MKAHPERHAGCLMISQRGLDCRLRKVQYEHNLCFLLMNFTCGRVRATWPSRLTEHVKADKFIYLSISTCCDTHKHTHTQVINIRLNGGKTFQKSCPTAWISCICVNTKASSQLSSGPDLCGSTLDCKSKPNSPLSITSYIQVRHWRRTLPENVNISTH